MRKLFAFTFIILLSGCGKWTSLRFGDGALSNAPIVNALAVTQEKVTIKGLKLDGVTGIKFVVPSKDAKAGVKEFKITSQSFGELIAVAIDAIEIPTNFPLEMILSTAEADTAFPIFFSLQDEIVDADAIQDDAVTTRAIEDGAVTRLKNGVDPDDSQQPVDGQILKWNASTQEFDYADDAGAGSGGTGTVTNVILGNGIVGAPVNETVVANVAVDTGVTGVPAGSKIPYFNNSNQVVLDSSANPTKVLFKNLGSEISIFNDTVLKFVDENDPGNFLMMIDTSGDVTVAKDLTVTGSNLIVNNKNVCLEDGTNCLPSSSGITYINTVPPLKGGGGAATVTIDIDVGTEPGDVLQLIGSGSPGELPAVDGSNLIGVVKGSGASVVGNISSFSDGSGNLIGDSGVAAQLVLDNQTSITSLQASNTSFDSRISTNTSDIATNKTDISNLDGRVTQNEADIAVLQGSSTDYVEGPASSTQYNIANFADASGKIIADSGISINSLTAGPATSTVDNFAVFSDGLGNLKDSNIKITDVVRGPATAATNTVPLFDGSGNVVNATEYFFPTIKGDDGQVLTTDAAGVVTWQTIAAGTGDVSGPESATATYLSYFADGTGKVIADSGIPFSQITDNQTNISALEASNTGFNVRVSALETSSTDYESRISVNETDISNNSTQIGAIDATLTTFDGRITQNETDIDVLQASSTDYSASISALQASSTDYENRISTNETDIETLQTEVAGHRQVPLDVDPNSKVLISTGLNTSSWLPDGLPGQVLSTNGIGNVSWETMSLNGLNWKNEWVPGTYQKNDTVIDFPFTMVANKTTTDSPSPQPVGLAAFFNPDDPTWTDNTSATVAYTGIEFTLTELASFSGVRVWIPEIDPNITYTLYLINVSDPSNNILIESSNINAYQTGWFEVSTMSNFYGVGTILRLVLKTIKFTSQGTWTDNWQYYDNVNDLFNPPDEGEVGFNNGHTEIYLHEDSLFNNRSVDVSNLGPGDQIHFQETGSGSSDGRWSLYDINSNDDNGGAGWHTLGVTRVENGNNLRNDRLIIITATTSENVANSPYVQIDDCLLDYPDVRGFFTPNYGPNITTDENCYGVDAKRQYYIDSEDWDLLALSGGAAGGGTGDGGDVSGPETSVDNGLSLFNGDTGNALKSTDYAFPPNDGSPTYILQTDGAGNVSWVDPSVAASFTALTAKDVKIDDEKNSESLMEIILQMKAEIAELKKKVKSLEQK